MTQQNTMQSVHPFLQSGEKLFWAGRPGQGLRLNKSDSLLIPFSLMWGGFTIFWESTALTSKAPLLFDLWGIPFVVIGLYLIIGRFFWDAWVRSQQVYAVTSSRLIVLRGSSIKSNSLRNLPQLNLASWGKSGSIDFGATGNGYSRQGNPWSPSSNGSSFRFLDNANEVYAIIIKAQQAV